MVRTKLHWLAKKCFHATSQLRSSLCWHPKQETRCLYSAFRWTYESSINGRRVRVTAARSPAIPSTSPKRAIGTTTREKKILSLSALHQTSQLLISRYTTIQWWYEIGYQIVAWSLLLCLYNSDECNRYVLEHAPHLFRNNQGLHSLLSHSIHCIFLLSFLLSLDSTCSFLWDGQHCCSWYDHRPGLEGS